MRFTGLTYEAYTWDFDNNIVENDMILVAQWELITYHVTLPVSNEVYTVTSSTNTVEHGGELTFTVSVAQGYNIDNMVILANGTKLAPVSQNDGIITYTIGNITDNITVIIRGIGIDTYAVTYHPSTTEYVANMPQGQIKEHGTAIVLSLLEPQRFGYTFTGWAAEENGEVVYEAGSEYTIDADIELYAVWTPMTYTITYETNGGTINSGEINEYVYSVGAQLPSDVTKEGFDFVGWYDNEYLEGARITVITPTDSGNKKYYAGYTVSGVVPNSYEGVYDGSAHVLEYTLVDVLTVQTYQWYFKASDSSMFVPVPSESALSYSVSNVSESGEYYCYVEALQDGYVIRFNTGLATVEITKKLLAIKAGDAEKPYDNLPLTSESFEFAESTEPAGGHTAKVTMMQASTITNAGTVQNVVQEATVYDSDGNDVTSNYEITFIPGNLTVTALPLTVEGKTITKYKNTSLKESELYKITGVLDGEELSFDNLSFVITNSKGETVDSLSDVISETGTYTVEISFNGFTGDGSENYIANGTVISKITVNSRPSGGVSSSGGGSGSGTTSPPEYVVSFETNGAEKIDSVTVVENQKVNEPNQPSKDGYIFDGWYTDKNLTVEHDFSSKVTRSFTLYAKWTEDTSNDDEEDATNEDSESTDEDSSDDGSSEDGDTADEDSTD